MVTEAEGRWVDTRRAVQEEREVARDGERERRGGGWGGGERGGEERKRGGQTDRERGCVVWLLSVYSEH